MRFMLRKELSMANYDFQNDFLNDAARKNYDAAMNGETRKGMEYFEKPHLWDEERPCDIKDTPVNNFVPIPVINTGDGFRSYSPLKKALVITGIVAAVVLVTICAVTYFMDGGGKHMGLSNHFW